MNKIYDNCEVYNNDGELLSFTNYKKAMKLVKKGLVQILTETPLRIQFIIHKKTKTPVELLQARENICVVCGIDHDLTRHHTVPYEYTKYLGLKFKKYNYGNVLAVCNTCHREYEKKAQDVKKMLEDKYEAPHSNKIGGFIYSTIHTILNIQNIPKNRIEELYKKLSNLTSIDIDELTTDKLYDILDLNHRRNFIPHGKKVINSVNIEDFVSMWKEHFLITTKPKYLPYFWYYYLDNPIKDVM